MMTDMQQLISTGRDQDEAHLWIQYTFEDSWRDTRLTFRELRQYINLRDNNWMIPAGEPYVTYRWDGEEVTESQAMRNICIRLELYPPENYWDN